MRITIVSETAFPQVNGVSRTLDRLVRHLCGQGDQVQLLVPAYSEPWDGDPEGARRLSFKAIPVPFYREIVIPFVGNARIRRELSNFGTDLVHVVTEGPLGWQGLRAARRLDLPLVTSYHTNFSQYMRYYHVGFVAPVLWRYLRWFHNRGARTFCPSPSICQMLMEKGFENVQVWSRGVECDTFHPDYADPELRRSLGLAENDVAILYAGRLASEKNLDVLMRAFLSLDSAHTAKLVLVGDGPFRGHLEGLATDRVVFTGYKRGRELSALYASCDLFVFPSLTDTFGNVMLEAMASGVPAIGFDAPGPRDVIQDGTTGLVVAECTVQALADAIGELLSDPDRRAAMAAEARNHAERQTWDRINQVVRDAYGEVIARDQS